MSINQQHSQQQLYEAIAYAPTERLRSLAERCLQDGDVKVMAAPSTSLVMSRVRETVDGEPFNLGEVLVTVCEVTLDGKPGWGMIMGQDYERALCAAVLDAAVRHREGVREELAAELAAAQEARRERWHAVQPTRVEFEEMA